MSVAQVIDVNAAADAEPDLTDGFHLVIDVIDRVPGLGAAAAHLRQQMVDERLRARAYTRVHGEDDPAISGWTWPY